MQRIESCEEFKDPTIRALYDDTVLMRFLRARALDITKATQLILEDIQWRATFKPHEIRLDDIEFQATTGTLSSHFVLLSLWSDLTSHMRALTSYLFRCSTLSNGFQARSASLRSATSSTVRSSSCTASMRLLR